MRKPICVSEIINLSGLPSVDHVLLANVVDTVKKRQDWVSFGEGKHRDVACVVADSRDRSYVVRFAIYDILQTWDLIQVRLAIAAPVRIRNKAAVAGIKFVFESLPDAIWAARKELGLRCKSHAVVNWKCRAFLDALVLFAPELVTKCVAGPAEAKAKALIILNLAIDVGLGKLSEVRGIRQLMTFAACEAA